MTRGRIWDMFQPNWSIFEFYPHITFDLGFHGQNAVWKNVRHVCLVGRTFLCILIHEFPNTNKMGTGFWSKTYRPTLESHPQNTTPPLFFFFFLSKSLDTGYLVFSSIETKWYQVKIGLLFNVICYIMWQHYFLSNSQKRNSWATMCDCQN